METFIIIAFVFLLLLFFVFSAGNENYKKHILGLKEMGFETENIIKFDNYICGHPDMNEQFGSVSIIKKGEALFIFMSDFQRSFINISSVKNISIQDKDTIEKNITAGRLLAVGVLAFAWKKDVKKELTYLIIDWNDGRFDHSTIFEFKNTLTMRRANTARNDLMRMCK